MIEFLLKFFGEGGEVIKSALDEEIYENRSRTLPIACRNHLFFVQYICFLILMVPDITFFLFYFNLYMEASQNVFMIPAAVLNVISLKH